MPNISGGISRFWKELKRRNVLRSLAVFAGTAFVILEASSIIFPRWNLPDWSIDLVLYLLILGGFITAILAWIFDITPSGVERTSPLESGSNDQGTSDSKVWKAATFISIMVIVGLIILNIFQGGKGVRKSDIQSLVILPFDNFTGDEKLEYFVEGMHASLIGDMGKLSGLRVISKTSSNIYKDVALSIPEIAEELAVDAVVETQVMCLGDTICLQIRVVTPFPEERLLWAADYREEKSQILNLYSRVTGQIANEVQIELSPDEELVLSESRTVDEEAYDDYLMGLFYWDKLSKEALEINPNDAISRIYYAHLLMILQRTDESLKQGQMAVDLDPMNPLVLALHAVVLSSSGQWDKAFKHLEKAISIDPKSFFAHHIMEFVSYEVGRADAFMKSVRFLFPFSEEENSIVEKTAQEKGLNASYEEVVALLEGLQESSYLVPVHMATRYVRIQQYDKLLEQLELGFQYHDQNMPYIATGLNKLNPVYDDPRFQEMIKALKLPMPENVP